MWNACSPLLSSAPSLLCCLLSSALLCLALLWLALPFSSSSLLLALLSLCPPLLSLLSSAASMLTSAGCSAVVPLPYLTSSIDRLLRMLACRQGVCSDWVGTIMESLFASYLLSACPLLALCLPSVCPLLALCSGGELAEINILIQIFSAELFYAYMCLLLNYASYFVSLDVRLGTQTIEFYFLRLSTLGMSNKSNSEYRWAPQQRWIASGAKEPTIDPTTFHLQAFILLSHVSKGSFRLRLP
jgi:hypothetical protein